ncbi:ABC-type transporter involved in resistance to organic solvents, ATP-binding protein [Desulfamplus magnetovallimortis]|uniref:ABC-type transporter involved in resistance to organic solvents, ATP-binding protein n=1 Tax=Desulfamplus magnetovallimortis TaxID=1246637 RepID=A0A1W1HDL1_9BACT|nr:ATP-binding cassette domain-containing protein [Desulfamplus magnetovallimortis]SLM30482.1 ABC-type transporter involved in resistance to organic solvents, ATP-binding protein [Desulfamplus magnetovallimortis]
MTSPLIELKNIHKKFGTNHVMQGVDLSINEGEITTIIGKSGTGKSVLLKHIIGLMHQDSGKITFSGKDTGTMTHKERRAFKQRFSYMFQENALFDSMTIYDNIALPLSEKAVFPRDIIRAKVKTRMEQLDIGETASKYPAQLSGGMKKRVALARALVTEPDIVLFDEPTTGLDPLRKNGVHKMIHSYQKMFGFTAVVVSHEIPDIFTISQKVAMLDKGRIIFQGTPEEIMNCEVENIYSFIHGKGDVEFE